MDDIEGKMQGTGYIFKSNIQINDKMIKLYYTLWVILNLSVL
jgi:hypothetical protein